MATSALDASPVATRRTSSASSSSGASTKTKSNSRKTRPAAAAARKLRRSGRVRGGRDEDAPAAGRHVDRRAGIQPGGFQEFLVEHERDAVPGAGQLLPHVRTIAPAVRPRKLPGWGRACHEVLKHLT